MSLDLERAWGSGLGPADKCRLAEDGLPRRSKAPRLPRCRDVHLTPFTNLLSSIALVLVVLVVAEIPGDGVGASEHAVLEHDAADNLGADAADGQDLLALV